MFIAEILDAGFRMQEQLTMDNGQKQKSKIQITKNTNDQQPETNDQISRVLRSLGVEGTTKIPKG